MGTSLRHTVGIRTLNVESTCHAERFCAGSGARNRKWIWNLADLHFPGAIQIVDLYHARQHLWAVACKLYPNDEAKQKAWMKMHQKLLDSGKIEKLVGALRAIKSENVEIAEKVRTEADYFERNRERMRIPSSSPTPLCWLRCDRSWLQNCDCGASQEISGVLDRSRGERNRGPTLLPAQWRI